MSTLAYAALTRRRTQATRGTSFSTSPPGVTKYTDALAALVPAEVLTLHAVMLSLTTKTTQVEGGNSVTEITDPRTLCWTFGVLCVLSIFLYSFARIRGGGFDFLDVVRALIPPVAFVAWTMLQKSTAFDAVCPKLEVAPRTGIALLIALILGTVAGVLADEADKKT